MQNQCTPEEIERKRREALEKLRLKKLNLQPTTTTILSPNNNQFKFRQKSPKALQKPYEKPTVIAKPILNFYNNQTITGQCVLLTEQRFQVDLAVFNEHVLEIFKTIPSRNYDVHSKKWDFDINDHNLLITKLQQLRPNIMIEKLPNYVVNCLTQKLNDLSTIDLSRLEPELYNSLMPFQLDGIRYGVDKKGRYLIGDDMGLGKTFQALGVANYYKKDWPVLITTTASMKNIWEETIQTYLPSIPLMKIMYITSHRDYIGDCDILIVSHDFLSRHPEKFEERHFGVFIVDESHVFKNFKAKCTKTALELARRSKRCILLSGTPVLSRPNELFTQLSMIDGHFFGTFIDYSRRYCDGKQTNFGWDSSGRSNLKELEILLNRKFMIRRTKDDVLKTLPKKQQEIVYLDVNLNKISENERKLLESLYESYMNETTTRHQHTILLTFFSETAKIKVPSVCSYILQVLENGEKFLVFAHHQIMMDSICDLIRKRNIHHIRIDGSTPSETRKSLVDQFQYNDKCRVAVLSITAANAGITLTAAKLVIFAELHWNPSILTQAESRAHRIGQTEPVIIRYLLASGTADTPIWNKLQDKHSVLHQLGLVEEKFVDIKQKPKSDISRYFVQPSTSCGSEINENNNSYNSNMSIDETCDIFNDGFDDLLSNIDVDS